MSQYANKLWRRPKRDTWNDSKENHEIPKSRVLERRLLGRREGETGKRMELPKHVIRKKPRRQVTERNEIIPRSAFHTEGLGQGR